MRKKLFKLLVSFLSIGFFLTIFLLIRKESGVYEFKEGQSFSETQNLVFQLSEEEKTNIIQTLNNNLVENDNTFGFKGVTDYADLYYINSLVEISKTLQDDDFKNNIKSKYNSLTNLDLSSYDSDNILNILYYVNICEYLDFSYNINDVYKRLENYYDDEAKLFCLINKKDTLNTKISITSFAYELIPDIVNIGNFDIITGAKNAYKDFDFTIDNNKTFYNSGADILYCYWVLGLIDNSIISEHMDWFEFWKSKYESVQLDSLINALNYAEYYKIAIIFDNNYSADKIQGFYDNLSLDAIPDDIDYYMICNTIKYANHLDNASFNNQIIDEIINDKSENPLLNKEIDLLSTVYGVILAPNCDFEINSEKLQNYIIESYNKISKSNTNLDQVNNLYYTIILDEFNNDFNITCEPNIIQDILDGAIKSLKFKENIVNDVVASRKIIEIVVDLQIHDMDVHINNNQVNKITKGLEKALKNDEIVNSVLITDIFIVNNLLNTEIMDSSQFYSTYSESLLDGGNKALIKADYPTDIYSTYLFFACLYRNNDFDNLAIQQNYVESLKVTDGIYSYGPGFNEYFDLGSILYGNAIIKTVIGGDKF